MNITEALIIVAIYLLSWYNTSVTSQSMVRSSSKMVALLCVIWKRGASQKQKTSLCFEHSSLSCTNAFSIELSHLHHSIIRRTCEAWSFWYYKHPSQFILPCSVLAARNLGEPAYGNFLDHTYLGDRRTTIREYLATTGAGIMEEEPPESLKSRYGGWFDRDSRSQPPRNVILSWLPTESTSDMNNGDVPNNAWCFSAEDLRFCFSAHLLAAECVVYYPVLIDVHQ
jgi:hypothetical protein